MDRTQPHTEPAEVDPRPTPRPGTRTTPQWGRVFADALAHGPGGYAYCVMKDGELASNGSWGFARMPADTPEVISAPGEGTTIRIRLPLTADPHSVRGRPEPSVAEPHAEPVKA